MVSKVFGSTESQTPSAGSALPSSSVAQDLAGLFRAMSDPSRLRIIAALIQGEWRVSHLAEVLQMSQSAVSHQLRDMRQMGWVRYRKEGRCVFYALVDPHVEDLFLQGLAHIGEYHESRRT